MKNIIVDTNPNKKVARTIIYEQDGKQKEIKLIENDLALVTNGSITESSTYGDQENAAVLDSSPGGNWSLWKNFAALDSSPGGN